MTDDTNEIDLDAIPTKEFLKAQRQESYRKAKEQRRAERVEAKAANGAAIAEKRKNTAVALWQAIGRGSDFVAFDSEKA